MKRLLLFLAIVATTVFSSCEGPQGPAGSNGTNIESEVFELRNVNFDYNTIDGFNIYRTLSPNILDADVLLVYRLTSLIDSNTPVWKLVPNAVYASQGEINYDFDFSKEDFKIYVSATYDLNTTPAFLDNQTFRVVIVPGYFSGKKSPIDKSDYNAVIKYYNINDSNIKVIN
jgi:hypothetical protein